MNNTVKDSAIKKLKLLITVVDRPKGEFYLDVLGQYNVNFQMVTNGQGTANSQLLELLGLEPHKAVIFSVVREDLVEEIMNCLEDKFHSVRGGKGICFAEDVMDVARENGARGGTILNARGVVKEDTAHFFGITVHADKEILMMVVEKTIVLVIPSERSESRNLPEWQILPCVGTFLPRAWISPLRWR